MTQQIIGYSGETLSDIAWRHWGDNSQFDALRTANPNLEMIGVRLAKNQTVTLPTFTPAVTRSRIWS